MAESTDGRRNNGGRRSGAGRKPESFYFEVKELIKAAVAPDDFIQVVKAITQKAKEGDVKCAAFIFDRFYGKPAETVISTTDTTIKVEFEELDSVD